MTQNKLNPSDDLVRIAHQHACDAEGEFLELLTDTVHEQLVQEVAVLAEPVDLARWLPRQVLIPSCKARRAVRSSRERAVISHLLHRRN
jgi:hypothetical protein